jgi:hypothetical protein
MGAVRGTVYERTSEGGIGDTIAGAELTFRAEDGDVDKTVQSDPDGSYGVDLPGGRYVATATQSGYKPFSTEPGFVVVEGSGIQTFNVFMKPGGGSRPSGPTVTDFTPVSGYGGTKVTIHGSGFAQTRDDNAVTVGGVPATVVSATSTELVVLVGNGAQTGPVEVTVNGSTGGGPQDFTVLPYPSPGSKTDGPPIHFEGSGKPDGGGAAGAGTGGSSGAGGGAGGGAGATLSTTGSSEVLVSLVKPSDKDPPDATAARNDVDGLWSDAATFYDQASFGDLTLDYTLTSDWAELTGTYDDYINHSAENFDTSQINRLFAEAADAAGDDGEDLDEYDSFVAMMYTDGDFLRAWNMGFRENFSYSPESIDISVSNAVSTIALGTASGWDRCAHEIGHGLVDAPDALGQSDGNMVAGEDVYRSDLIDKSVATADVFEMMGWHLDQPLFSAFFMTQLGWYDSGNTNHVRSLSWDRNPTSRTFQVVAHGRERNTNPGKCHVVELEVTDGLSYFIEVRQRPGDTDQVFDGDIPLNGASNKGGVVVTKVLTDEVNLNQQMRFITLLHDPEVLSQGDTAIDPARDITIEVTDDAVDTRPLTCEVTVEWAQDIDPDPEGKFDLNIEPWDSNWQSPDIWVDRQPYGSYDKDTDSQGRPKGNGDKPKPGEVNKFTARIENDGSDDATGVTATYYTVEPPGIGDNGNWAPLKTVNLGTIAAGNDVDESVNWVPVVDKHTCLKVEIGEQRGETAFGNNRAQENVFEFTAPASSMPGAVTMQTAVRNPKDEETVAFLSVRNVPEGYTVQFPHQWVWLDPKEERQFELTVVPTQDYSWYRTVHAEAMTAGIILSGSVPRIYPDATGSEPELPTWQLPIGGVTADITPKREVELELDVRNRAEEIVTLAGMMTPAMEDEPVSVSVTDPRDRRRVAEAVTDRSGRFEVTMDMSKPAPGRRGEDIEGFVPGTYRGQAYTISAPNAAETESNLVHFDVSRDAEVDDPAVSPSSGLLDVIDDFVASVQEFVSGAFSRFTGGDRRSGERRDEQE